ncbi:hypothetical protein TNCV_3780081 [Trichonephila clavipes]|nr:hypothetical protein TNCV_3780081 [Trichonephila clavipes]
MRAEHFESRAEKDFTKKDAHTSLCYANVHLCSRYKIFIDVTEVSAFQLSKSHTIADTGSLFRLGILDTYLGRKRLEGEKREKIKISANVQCLSSHDRSISSLKVKTEMRFTMENEKLNCLIRLCTQNDITPEIGYNDVTNDFTLIKDRRKPLFVPVQ